MYRKQYRIIATTIAKLWLASDYNGKIPFADLVNIFVKELSKDNRNFNEEEFRHYIINEEERLGNL